MIYLTFDTDHMDETRMSEFLETVSFPGEGTFFCTQQYECLTRTNHELSPHPYLGEENDWAKELANMRRLFPQSVGWRAHSCVFSHILALWLCKNNYKYVSTHDNFGATDIYPHKHMWGVWHFPIYYMDNMDFSRHLYWHQNAGEKFSKELLLNAVNGSALYIFDFHPIHLLLNTPGPEYYFEKRDAFKAGVSIDKIRFQGYGTFNFFQELCMMMDSKGLSSNRLDKLVTELETSPQKSREMASIRDNQLYVEAK